MDSSDNHITAESPGSEGAQEAVNTIVYGAFVDQGFRQDTAQSAVQASSQDTAVDATQVPTPEDIHFLDEFPQPQALRPHHGPHASIALDAESVEVVDLTEDDSSPEELGSDGFSSEAQLGSNPSTVGGANEEGQEMADASFFAHLQPNLSLEDRDHSTVPDFLEQSRRSDSGPLPQAVLLEAFDIGPLLDPVRSGVDTSTYFSSIEEANLSVAPHHHVNLEDHTIPRSDEQKKAIVKAISNAIASHDQSGDGITVTKPFRDGKYPPDRIEITAWNVLESCIARHNIGPLLATFGVKSKGSANLTNFAERMSKILYCLRTRKTICKHLLEPLYMFGFVDDPVDYEKRIAVNKSLNDRKGVVMDAGKRAMNNTSAQSSQTNASAATNANTANPSLPVQQQATPQDPMAQQIFDEQDLVDFGLPVPQTTPQGPLAQHMFDNEDLMVFQNLSSQPQTTPQGLLVQQVSGNQGLMGLPSFPDPLHSLPDPLLSLPDPPPELAYPMVSPLASPEPSCPGGRGRGTYIAPAPTAPTLQHHMRRRTDLASSRQHPMATPTKRLPSSTPASRKRRVSDVDDFTMSGSPQKRKHR